MVNITLPDGSNRQFPGPISVADVAASIGAGLAKAALGDAETVRGYKKRAVEQARIAMLDTFLAAFLLWGVVVGAGSGCMATVFASTVASRWFVAPRTVTSVSGPRT